MTDNQRLLVLHTLKLPAILVYLALWGLAYKYLNALGAASPRANVFEGPLQAFPSLYQPWMAVIYVFGGYVIILLPFFFNWRNNRDFTRVLLAYTITSVAAFVVYGLWPVVMERPDYAGSSFGEYLMRQVVAVDDPANCFPSSHTFYAILGALLVWGRTGRRWFEWAVWLLSILICVSTITVGQHYFIDVAGGVVVAIFGFYTSRSIPKEERRKT